MKRKILTCLFLLLLFISLDLSSYFTLSQSARDNWEMVTLNDPYYRYGLTKNKSGIINFGSLQARYYTNSLGMRDRRIRNVPLVSGRHRILFTGDSFIEGVGYAYDSTFCGFLSDMLDTSRYEVLNAGVRGYSPRLDYLYIDYLVRRAHLKINDVYCALNSLDVMDELIFQNFTADTLVEKKGILQNAIEFYGKYSEINIAWGKLAAEYFVKRNNLTEANSFLYYTRTDNEFNEETQRQFLSYRTMWSEPKLLHSAVCQKALALSFGNLKKLAGLCRDNGIQLHLVVYPYAFVVSSLKSPPDYMVLNKSFISIFRKFADDNQIDFTNLFPLFTGEDDAQNKINFQKYFIPGDEHWNAAGHKRIADSLYCIINK